MASCLNRARARAFTFAAGLASSASSSPRGMSGGVRQNSCSATQKASPYPIGSTATMSTAKAAEEQIAVSGSTTTIISAKRSAAAFFGLSVAGGVCDDITLQTKQVIAVLQSSADRR